MSAHPHAGDTRSRLIRAARNLEIVSLAASTTGVGELKSPRPEFPRLAFWRYSIIDLSLSSPLQRLERSSTRRPILRAHHKIFTHSCLIQSLPRLMPAKLTTTVLIWTMHSSTTDQRQTDVVIGVDIALYIHVQTGIVYFPKTTTKRHHTKPQCQCPGEDQLRKGRGERRG